MSLDGRSLLPHCVTPMLRAEESTREARWESGVADSVVGRNIEVKVRLVGERPQAALAAARQVAERIADRRLGRFRQVDTYFHCGAGRLKLREIEGQTAQLIAYTREDRAEARGSDYQWVEVDDTGAMKRLLTAVLGVRVIVAKTREIFLVSTVRIHLDEVEGLGAFLEFEAVLEVGDSDAQGRAAVDRLCEQFRVDRSDFVAKSYSELLQMPAAG